MKNETNERKSGSGGARQGSGRKKKESKKVPFFLYLFPHDISRLGGKEYLKKHLELYVEKKKH